MPQRLRQLEEWLASRCGLPPHELAPASADASFRRYFRVTLPDASTLIAMDAPPDKEDCRPFVAVAGRMATAGLHVPRIIEQDLDKGFLLLEDLGSRPYLAALNPDTAHQLYGDALRQLLRLQSAVPIDGLPAYDRTLLLREMALFADWLLREHLGMTLGKRERRMLDDSFDRLVDNALAQPVVCVHRDFHSRNLMVTQDNNPGVIDFQDAVAGPVTYDLVSLLRDCYVSWPGAQVDAWVDGYYRAVSDAGVIGSVDRPVFCEWFDLMGVQRHLKASGIFARLHHRDGKPGYLADIPRTLGYIVSVGQRRAALRPLSEFVAARVLPCL
jgi:aminoglycoside/choline kinase family phosphotransferase